MFSGFYFMFKSPTHIFSFTTIVLKQPDTVIVKPFVHNLLRALSETISVETTQGCPSKSADWNPVSTTLKHFPIKHKTKSKKCSSRCYTAVIISRPLEEEKPSDTALIVKSISFILEKENQTTSWNTTINKEWYSSFHIIIFLSVFSCNAHRF